MTRYRDKPGWHRHQCLECGLVWEHQDTHKGDVEAHRCPCCGNVCLFWYEGPTAPDRQHPEDNEAQQ